MANGFDAPYVAKPWAITAYFFLFATAVAVVLATDNARWRLLGLESVLPGFYTHTSNLILSFLLLLTYGFLRLHRGGGLREIMLLGAIIIACNVIYEVFLTLYNTRDIVDAYYGAAGVAVATAFFVLMKRYGLRPNMSRRPRAHARADALDGR